ncbi:MAG TPA: PqiC family protein [Methylomirabilota bacterium]|nr:PqiC family protein [Methylomirabilota bacterium]
MRATTLRVTTVGLLAAAVGLAACASVKDPTKYYILGAAPAAAQAPARPAAADTGPTVGVGPVLIAGYLDRTAIVTRNADGQLDVSMYQRWAEPLELGVAQTLVSELAARLGTERVIVYPWRGRFERVIDYQVGVVVIRFDGTLGRDVTLDARWRIVDRELREIGLKRSTITQPVNGDGYPALVTAMNQAVAGLGGEIAAEIRALPGKRAAGGS